MNSANKERHLQACAFCREKETKTVRNDKFSKRDNATDDETDMENHKTFAVGN